ncbi:MAG: putative oxidoreductase [Rhodobacteraceae bacterium HLUCCA12]|nr:MAG: putative oxidoreductase [Rhodobacteraceae bacterium HLUCCA12]
MILIAGGGIVGLSLALTAHSLGFPVRVFEQVDKPAPLGVGINLQPQAVREIREMGLGPALDAIGLRIREVAYFSKRGNPIWSEPRGTWAGYNWPQYSVHRGEFQMMLLRAAQARLPSGSVLTGWRATGYDQDGDTVRLHLENRDGETRVETGDLLIGCDGIHSAIRAQMHPDDGPPVWGGAVLWRATSYAEPFLTGASMAMAGHEWQKFVTYPISKPDADTGLATVNWIAELKYEPTRHWNKEDYNRPGKLDDFLPSFEDWAFDWLDIPALIRKARTVYEFPMVDRNPLPFWTEGRVTLAGDAAHAMYPIGSNGASQGIIDARLLGARLRDHGLSETALTTYEAERRPITTRIVLANRSNGPDQVMELVEQRSGGVYDDVREVLSEDELNETARTYKRLVGLDIDELNARPPIL